MPPLGNINYGATYDYATCQPNSFGNIIFGGNSPDQRAALIRLFVDPVRCYHIALDALLCR